MQGAWVAQLVKQQTPGFSSGHYLTGHDLMGVEIKPCIGLNAQQGVCLRFSPSPSSLTHSHTYAHSLKFLKKKEKRKYKRKQISIILPSFTF